VVASSTVRVAPLGNFTLTSGIELAIATPMVPSDLLRVLPLLILAALLGGCSGPAESPTAQPAKTSEATDAPDEPLPAPVYELGLPEDMRSKIEQVFPGDLDGMIERRFIRAGVPFNRTYYFVDRGTPRGLSYEYLTRFEEDLNKTLKTGNLKIHVVLLPMPRDQLLPMLNAGKLDMVVAQLTVTPERQKLVAFSNPTRSNVNEVVVTGPGAPAISSVEELSGQTVFLRKGSSYYDSVQALNARLVRQGKPPVAIEVASESLEDDDILEMVNAGLVPATVVDDYLADFWKKVFTDLTVHSTLTLRTGGNLAVAIRRDSPRLGQRINEFVAKNSLNSTIGQVLNQRYLVNTKYVTNATSQAERKKFLAMRDLFKKYGDQYSFDYLMMGALAYQESRLDHSVRSQVGAIGVMQVMPETGKAQKVGDITQLEPNIHAGVKFMSVLRDQYFAKEPMDDLNKTLFTFAAYNAGPGRVRQLRREAEKRGLDPNLWFGNVERIASERIGRETVGYVSSIYKYYVAYHLLTGQMELRQKAKDATTPKISP
jgi:membrane-bound lytic murein transglycosylase MltF